MIVEFLNNVLGPLVGLDGANLLISLLLFLILFFTFRR